jgi:uncharacterized protein (TIGR02145 family)
MSQYIFDNQTNFYKGKVRDVYSIGSDILVMVASNRISAFDVILPAPIPFKGQVLNQIAAYMLNTTKDICPNWLISSPAPNVSIGKRCIPFKIEMVVRGNLTGHAWRTYSSGKRILCGVTMPEGLRENDYFPTPIITPSTKASEGHDEDISKEEIIAQGLASTEDWKILEREIGMSEEESNALAWRGTNEAEKLVVKYSLGWPEGYPLFGTDEYEFGAKPAGCRLFNGEMNSQGNLTFWWTSSTSGNEGWYRYLDANQTRIFRQHTYKGYGMSIRCVKNN